MKTNHQQREKRLIEKATQAGHGHIFRWFHELGPEGKNRLLDQVDTIDFDLVARLVKEHVEEGDTSPAVHELEPAPVIGLPSTPEEAKRAQQAESLGVQLLREGKVAVLTVAGGQGSRLGFEGPKGTFPIGPITNKTIFQLLAEKIRANAGRYGAPIPWYIMTSETNDSTTREFFEQHDYLGLDRRDVKFFQQGMLPAVDPNGKVILDAKDHLFVSPDGHGGSLLALEKTGMVADMKRRGVEQISYNQVDNVLIKVVDPLFVGYHAGAGAEMSSKIIPKRDPEEKLGVIGLLNGTLSVIEYSDLSKDEKYATNSDGALKYSAGSIAIHMIRADFVDRITSAGFSLPYHRANKAVPFLNDQGEPVTPKEKNGIKFEAFVFDALALAKASVTMEVIREEEFAPVKDPEGLDSPASARRALVNLWGRWLRGAGVDVPTDDKGNVDGLIEISPLFAVDAHRLAERLRGRSVRFDRRLLLEAE